MWNSPAVYTASVVVKQSGGLHCFSRCETVQRFTLLQSLWNSPAVYTASAVVKQSGGLHLFSRRETVQRFTLLQPSWNSPAVYTSSAVVKQSSGLHCFSRCETVQRFTLLQPLWNSLTVYAASDVVEQSNSRGEIMARRPACKPSPQRFNFSKRPKNIADWRLCHLTAHRCHQTTKTKQNPEKEWCYTADADRASCAVLKVQVLGWIKEKIVQSEPSKSIELKSSSVPILVVLVLPEEFPLFSLSVSKNQTTY